MHPYFPGLFGGVIVLSLAFLPFFSLIFYKVLFAVADVKYLQLLLLYRTVFLAATMKLPRSLAMAADRNLVRRESRKKRPIGHGRIGLPLLHRRRCWAGQPTLFDKAGRPGTQPGYD